ncbi:DUF1116 domain-containing protein [Thermogemmatispora onikobensis]|uniref:DUF1116 domain-containing protein n=1 Tax=Thermogemmatispora onikobensis TaxID=732234 RepID=UPI0008539D63|nr:DUF1116 domain-containing protein [Thermogemmatispora onikobensis]
MVSPSTPEQLSPSPFTVINVGAELFAEALRAQGVTVTSVAWRPPAGDPAALARLLADPAIDRANEIAVGRMLAAEPVLVDVQPARTIIPLFRETAGGYALLHAGPPITWERMCGPMRGAIIGACLYEGWVRSEEEAVRLAETGRITFAPCHHYHAVGPMAGIVSPSMPLLIVEDRVHGNRTFAPLNEGLGKVLRYGAYAPEVIERLRWMQEVLGPALSRALRHVGGLDLRSLLAQALQMGDEGHNRNKAATSLFLRQLAPALVETGASSAETASVLRFIASNDHFHLNPSMAAAKAMTLAGANVPNSSVVVTMARNGVDFGIRVSGLGERWFVGPAQAIQGLYFAGFGPEDANPDIGDSAITETAGLGAFAMAGAPAIVQFIGGTPADALRYTREMYSLTVTTNPQFSLPSLNFQGTPTGIDIRQVCRLNLPPVINTGIAHRLPGIGQVGAGIVHPPMECFTAALQALADSRQSV